MVILVLMLLIGLFAGVWGFTTCFLPAQWDRLTEVTSFADRWTVPSSKRLRPIIRMCNRATGMVICIVGCWFTYVAASDIYEVFTGQAIIHRAPLSSGSPPNSPTTVGNVFSLLMIIIGVTMAIIPIKAVKALDNVWPAERSVKLPAPKIMLLVRVVGAIFALLATMFLVR
jgi:hypothetical protein